MKNAKKFMMCALVAAMTLSMTACGDKETEDKQIVSVESSEVSSASAEKSSEVAASSEVESTEVASSEVESSEVAPVSGDIVGVWTLKIDGGEAIAESMGVSADGVEFTIEMTMSFGADGKVELAISDEQLESMVDQMMVLGKTVALDSFYSSMEDNGYDKEAADALIQEQTGMTTEEYMVSALEAQRDTLKETFTAELEDLSKNGEYKIDGNKLFIVDAGEAVDETDYVLFELSGNTLRIYSEDGTEMMPGFCQDMILTR